MNLLSRLYTAVGAVRWLGAPAVWQNLLYRAGLLSGHYRRVTPLEAPAADPAAQAMLRQAAARPAPAILTLPEPETLRWLLEDGAAQLLDEAREITEGRVRLYGGEPVPLDLNPHTPPLHWTQAEKHVGGDIKDIWEPARLGWVYTLGRAYRLTGDAQYSQAFWCGFDTFQMLNPYNSGPNWSSGQEAALRIMALAFAWQVFGASESATPDKLYALTASIYDHACRIPPTLSYARSQQNNHQVSEAVGLITAAFLLPDAPQAPFWQETGWHELNSALEQQIAEDGTYIQQSVNYHRLMLDNALWVNAIEQKIPAKTEGIGYTNVTRERLAAAADWLAAQIDPLSGACPNLGANDGARILPLAAGGFADYRPVVQAAERAFCGRNALPAGPWDEQCLWLGVPVSAGAGASARVNPLAVQRLGDTENWATLRAVRFHGRPSQADQLHVDIWRKGVNIAVDAGTYRYNAPPPWDNALAGTAVHNTVSVNGADQMKRAGRFLWLDWADAQLLPGEPEKDVITAEHAGYTKLGILHRRSLERLPGGWLVTDRLLPLKTPARPHRFTLHWLVQDWPFTLNSENLTLRLETPVGPLSVQLTLSAESLPAQARVDLHLVRAGEILYGKPTGQEGAHSPVLPIHGWRSPIYSRLEPALSLLLSVYAAAPLEFQTRWLFL